MKESSHSVAAPTESKLIKREMEKGFMISIIRINDHPEPVVDVDHPKTELENDSVRFF